MQTETEDYIIEIDTDEIKSCANNLSLNVSSISSSISNFSSEIDNINDVWNGIDALAYINFMEGICTPELTYLKDLLGSYISYLTVVSNIYAQMDEEFSQKKITVV